MTSYLTEIGYDASKALLTDDPNEAQREAERVLSEAYGAISTRRAAARVAELREKKAAQTARLEESKKRAAVSSSGSQSAPTPAKKATKDLTEAELSAELDRLTGGLWKG